jgi:5-(carboxyamino)imidazole ribonucleotide synthase
LCELQTAGLPHILLHKIGTKAVFFAPHLPPRKNIDEGLAKQIQDLTERVLNNIDYVGVLAIECFVVDGKLLVNELAPRVHNSGHWTQQGAATSQFENHLRAIAGSASGKHLGAWFRRNG